MLITDLYCTNRSIGVSQVAPGSIRADRNIDKPRGSCEKSWDCWDFVVGALSPSLCLQSATVGQCWCALCHCVISPLCPLSSLFHSSVLWGARVNLSMSLVCHLAPQSTNLQLPTLPFLPLHCSLCCFRASNPKQREKGSTALGSKLSHQNKCKNFSFCGMELLWECR